MSMRAISAMLVITNPYRQHWDNRRTAVQPYARPRSRPLKVQGIEDWLPLLLLTVFATSQPFSRISAREDREFNMRGALNVMKDPLSRTNRVAVQPT